MTKAIHRIYIGVFVLIIVATLISLLVLGTSYYTTPLEERFYHPDHKLWKPSGPLGHGLGIVGTILIIIGVFSYMARKRIRRFSRIGVLKYWLEFHIFLCVLGPIMILFHTAFKFGGIVSISFWSMVVVVASGVIGRFIYIQIPRTIQGRELSLNEITEMKADLKTLLEEKHGLDQLTSQQIVTATSRSRDDMRSFSMGQWFSNWTEDRKTLKRVKKELSQSGVDKSNIQSIIKLVRREIELNNRIGRLVLMQKLFRYWHVAHLPFAIVMLIIMIIHVAVTLSFGYRWIF